MPKAGQIPHNLLDSELLKRLEIARAKGKKSFWFFCKYVLMMDVGKGKAPLSGFHRDLCGFYENQYINRKIVLVPRGHLKSTIGEAYILWRLVCNPDETWMIISSTASMSRKFLRNIKWHIRYNMTLRDYYPYIVPDHLISDAKGKKNKRDDDDKWGEYEIIVGGVSGESAERDYSVQAVGMEEQLAGSHPFGILFDDCINEQWVASHSMRDKALTQVQLAQSLLKPGGIQIFNGTYYSDQDLYNTLEKMELYEVFKRQAYTVKDDGSYSLLFPEKYCMTDLEIPRDEDGTPLKESFQYLRSVQGASHFSMQYMLNPVADVDKPFKENCFRYYLGEKKDGKLVATLFYFDSRKFVELEPGRRDFNDYVKETVLAVDTAYTSSKRNDETALACGSTTNCNKIFLHEVVGLRTESPTEVMNEVARLRTKYIVDRVGVESIGFGWLEERARMMANEYGDYSLGNIERLQPRGGIGGGEMGDKSKKMRIKGLLNWTEKHSLFLPLVLGEDGKLEKAGWVHMLEKQLLDFSPRTIGKSHDDRADSVAYIPIMSGVANERLGYKKRREQFVLRQEFVGSSITGY